MSGDPTSTHPLTSDGAAGRSNRILFATAEAYPFAKVGGLADVSDALPKELARLGHEVRVVLPGYRGLAGRRVLSIDVRMGPVTERVHVSLLASREGVEVYTVGCDGWFDTDVPYGYHDDDVLPFVLFSKAVAALAAHPDWRPDVIHGNDWHCGLVAQEARYGVHAEALERTAVVFTIHNIAYQGQVGASIDQTIGLPPAGSLLSRGIAFADQVSTVSPRYLTEILSPEHGAGMDALLRARGDDVRGILNGVDYREFTPEHDPWIDVQYDGTFVPGKRANKRSLQADSGLGVAPDRPLFGMVARLVQQKGVGLVCSVLDDIAARGGQVVVMGEGDRRYRRDLAAAARRNPDSVAFHPTAEEGLARRVYAGSDFFLAPSKFEPCGLTPLIALRYGAVPVVRHTGGMVDTIVDYAADPDRGLGFVFLHRRASSFLQAIDTGLGVYRRTPAWQGLQRRAMAADFSWRAPVNEYAALYRTALRKRLARAPVTLGPRGAPTLPATAARTPAASTRAPRTPAGPTQARPAPAPLPLALVHHANQYLITDGYTDREGLTSLLQGYAALLRLHVRYRVPASLHLSGTLVEAAAWHHPSFLHLVRDLRASGMLTLVGGTYSENVLTEFGEELNRRQLEELFWLYEHHLGCPPEELQVCWVPERVWRTERLSELLTSPDLPNGGYRYVLLDDRLLYPADGGYGGSDRELFDLADPAAPPPADALRPYRIVGSRGLEVVPMSTRLRYWVPPAGQTHWRSLGRMADISTAPGDDTVLVYADDLEKTAGVGPWDASALEHYESFLRWLVAQPRLAPVALPSWLAERRRPAAERAVEPGTFVELAQQWRAGEDYHGWTRDAAWTPYRRNLDRAHSLIRAAERDDAEPRLVSLAWKHLMASTYETAWHDVAAPGVPLAPWSRALGSHARTCGVLVAAARWFASEEQGAVAELVDLDGDGERELVVANGRLFAVLSPEHGGRLVYLATRSESGGALVVGNPSDDWNWQEPLNRYMDQPANHPGALADVGFVHDRYEVVVTSTGDAVVADLVDVQEGSTLRGARKRIVLGSASTALLVAYRLPAEHPALDVDVCLSTDYYALLRRGRRGARRFGGRSFRGVRNGPVAAWVALADGEETCWHEPRQAEVGHGMVIGLRADARSFHLLLGVGDTDAEWSALQMKQGLQILDRLGAPRREAAR
ncbi:glycogen/starch synthase [Nocardioides sp. WL0053]|uniref:Glycogen synthase n=1 Tax=Nocardioides jiangsuensis TaxID=2866161 RepID=A0ABS7RG21_9ACTN|nr:glycogen/starch synthase [Nocardioides jiangsuensis]MBY9073985.1 glycogen/starch synthase [Nocardioides jiangsuensis]